MSAFDVLIIGGGPAGAFSAHLLAKEGFKVALLDSAEEIKRKVCGEYLCPRGVTLLKHHGLFEMFNDKFLPVTGMDIFAPSGRKVESHFEPVDDVHMGMSLHRQVFDETLLDLARVSGAEVLLGQKVVAIDKQTDHWLIQTQKGKQFTARLIVGADGRKSFVAKHFDVQSPANPKRVALHCYLTGHGAESRQGEMHLFENGNYIGLDPISNSEINFSLVCDAEDVRRAGGAREAINEHIQKSKNLLDRFHHVGEDVKIFAVSPVHNSVVSISGNGWCLIGDASGFIDPLTGEGIYNGLLTAEILASELLAERQNSLNDWRPALKRYAQRRRDLLRSKSRLNTLFQWLIRQPRLVNMIAEFLSVRKTKADVFVGIIGNIYSPISGLIKLIRA